MVKRPAAKDATRPPKVPSGFVGVNTSDYTCIDKNVAFYPHMPRNQGHKCRSNPTR